MRIELIWVKFAAKHEFAAEVEECRRMFPFLMDLEGWLRMTPFAKQ